MPIDATVRAQLEIYRSHLDGLTQRGRQLRDLLAADPSVPSAISATRTWHEDCGVTINQLSGGSKSHWLARAFSQAFLMRSADGRAAEGAPPGEIVARLLDVLDQALASLSQFETNPDAPSAAEAPPPRRFEFVHNAELRPVVEQAYIDSRRALDQGSFARALQTSCGILEAIVTDALEHKGMIALAASGAPPGKIAEWSFNTRLAVAEKAGLIRSGSARLPAIARTYRENSDAGIEGSQNPTISERDARLAGQVLHVVMRDLDPGR